MCVVSNLGDAYARRWEPQPWYPPMQPPASGTSTNITIGVSREEFDKLKRDVEEMKTLLKAAKRIDEITGATDCEDEAKLAVLRKVAELVGVDLSDVLP